MASADSRGGCTQIQILEGEDPIQEGVLPMNELAPGISSNELSHRVDE